MRDKLYILFLLVVIGTLVAVACSDGLGDFIHRLSELLPK